MHPDWIENLLRVFDRSKEKRDYNGVAREHFLVMILEDRWFEPRLDHVVRESIDGVAETLDQILERINTSFKSEVIEWDEFLSFFTRRGQIRDSEQVTFEWRDLNLLQG